MASNAEFNRNMEKAFKRMKSGAVKGLRLGAGSIQTESMQRTPVDEGNLKSGHYTSVQVRKDSAVAEIGTTAEYAAAVHEITDNNHPVGEAKFLENAIEEKAPEVRKLIHKLTKVK
jgi:hypothetical protein